MPRKLAKKVRKPDGQVENMPKHSIRWQNLQNHGAYQ